MNEARLKEAARGYLYLEMPEEALDELSSISDLEDIEALDLKLAAYMMSKDWQSSIDTSRQLCKLRPRECRYFIHAAYCLHEVGETLKARETLLTGPEKLAEDPLFHYNGMLLMYSRKALRSSSIFSYCI